MSTVNGHDEKTLGVTLKPCPFCGSEVRTWMIDHDDRSLEQVIECNECGCNMHSYLATGSKESLDEAKRTRLFNKWNMRVGEKDEDAEG